MTQQELDAMTLEERIAYLQQELRSSLQERNVPSRVNINKLTAAQRAELRRNDKQMQNLFEDDVVFPNMRQYRYSHTTSSEDYTNCESQTQPNASMTIEAIYKRISQGKPITDTNLMDLTSSRDAGYDSSRETRVESLDAMWREPFENPLGTLERMQEMGDRYVRISEAISAHQRQLQQQSQPKEEPISPSEVTTGSYDEQRKAAKASKQAK